MCEQGYYSSAPGATSSAACLLLTSAPISPVFEFVIQYQLSDIAAEIKSSMTLAISSMLQVNASQVVLRFATTVLRRGVKHRILLQQSDIIVIVGLVRFQGSVATLASMITEDNLNSKFAAEGLKSVELLTIAPELGTNSSESTAISRANGPSTGIIVGAAVGGFLLISITLFGLSKISGSYKNMCLSWKNQAKVSESMSEDYVDSDFVLHVPIRRAMRHWSDILDAPIYKPLGLRQGFKPIKTCSQYVEEDCATALSQFQQHAPMLVQEGSKVSYKM